LPPRAEGHDRTAAHDTEAEWAGVGGEDEAGNSSDAANPAAEELPQNALLHDPLPEEKEHPPAGGMETARPLDIDAHDAEAPAREADANDLHRHPTSRDALESEPEGEPMLAPAAVAGLGAARFGGLNIAFDLDLPGSADGSSTTVAMPAQPMFSIEEIAKIARNKLELAREYIALGDLGGARTLIHEVIESNDEAHALLATLAPLS
jgi:FimV-like protein